MVRTRSGSLLGLLAADVAEEPVWIFFIVAIAFSTLFWTQLFDEPRRGLLLPAVFMGLLPGMFFLCVIWNVPARVWLGVRQARAFRRPAATPVAAMRTDRVRLVGFIESDLELDHLGGERPVVYMRTLTRGTSRGGSGRWREEIRGVPFRLRLSNGTAVRLDPTVIDLLDRPARLGPAVWQVVLSPGDAIEAIGSLSGDVSPAGEGAPGRGVPMIYTMLVRPDERVWVRRSRDVRQRRYGRLKSS
jgi:hypothetical protein